MVTSLKTDFAQIFSRCPKNLSCPKFGGAAAPLAPPARTPMGTRAQNFTGAKLPPGGCLVKGKRGTVPKIWRAVPIFLACVNGVYVSVSHEILSHAMSATRFYGNLSVYSRPLPSEKIALWQPSKKSSFGDSCFTYSNLILFHTNSLRELYRFETCIHLSNRKRFPCLHSLI